MANSELLLNLLTAVSDLGGTPWIIAVIVVLLAWYLVNKKAYHEIIFLIASLGSYPYSLLLKEIFKLPRPNGAIVQIYMHSDIYGYPSTHTVFYFVFWGTVIYLSWKLKNPDPLLMYIVRSVSSLLILSIGVSRVYLGVHSVYDVLGGYLFGLGYLLVLIIVDMARKLKQ